MYVRTETPPHLAPNSHMDGTYIQLVVMGMIPSIHIDHQSPASCNQPCQCLLAHLGWSCERLLESAAIIKLVGQKMLAVFKGDWTWQPRHS
jgi:primosomal replication protein N